MIILTNSKIANVVRWPRNYNASNDQVIYPLNVKMNWKSRGKRTNTFKMYIYSIQLFVMDRNDVSCGNIGVELIKIAGYDDRSSMRFFGDLCIIRFFFSFGLKELFCTKFSARAFFHCGPL